MFSLKSILTDLSQERINQVASVGIRGGGKNKCGSGSNKKSGSRKKSGSHKKSGSRSRSGRKNYGCGCRCGWGH